MTTSIYTATYKVLENNELTYSVQVTDSDDDRMGLRFDLSDTKKTVVFSMNRAAIAIPMAVLAEIFENVARKVADMEEGDGT